MLTLIARANAVLSRTPADISALLAQFIPAVIFWQSGQTKVDGFSIADSTWFLFEHEYNLPLIPPGLAAVGATIAEHLFPVLLIIGFATRLSALALLLMTAVIQIFVYPGAWLTHGLWAVCFLTVITYGPGRVSLDHLMGLDPARAK